MSVVELLDTLANQGVELWFEGERLRFRAPKGALTPDQRAQLSSRRPEVLAQLRKNAAVTRDFPLSFSQRSLWFVHQENPSSAAYNVAFQARVVSAVDVAALRQALQAVLDRHAALRTTYPVSDGVPVQRVAGTTEVAFTVLDARADDDTAFHERIRTDYRRPFDLESGPLFRATLFSRNPQEHVLLLVAHHVAADGWSLLQLLEELRVLYAEATGGAAALLPRPEVQYSDFTAWQAETLAGPEGDRLQQYWTEQLAVAPANLDLPSDRPRPVRSSPDGISLGFELDERLSTAVRQLARTESTTPFVILLATFKTLLSRYTGREDIIVGTPTFGRNRPEFARVIGDFVNTLPLRSLVDGNLSFRDFTARVRQTLFDALAAQEYPFPLIVEKVQPVRDPGRSPLFDIMFVLQRFDMVKELESVMIPRADAEPVDFGGLRLTHYPLAQQLGQFDLTLAEIVDESESARWHFKYNPDLFDRATIARMSDHVRVLLEGIVEDPTRPLGALPLLTRAERESAAPGVSAPHETIPVATLHARFEDQVARTPDAIAVTFEESSLTYAELNRRATRLAGRLRELGVHRDTLFGLCAERSLELIVGVVGISVAGGAHVPIDLSYPQERVAFMIEDAAVRVLVTQRALQDRLPSLAAKAVLLDDELAGYPDTNPAPASGPDDLAYVIYTSGSTGAEGHDGHASRRRPPLWRHGCMVPFQLDRCLDALSFDRVRFLGLGAMGSPPHGWAVGGRPVPGESRAGGVPRTRPARRRHRVEPDAVGVWAVDRGGRDRWAAASHEAAIRDFRRREAPSAESPAVDGPLRRHDADAREHVWHHGNLRARDVPAAHAARPHRAHGKLDRCAHSRPARARARRAPSARTGRRAG